MNVNGKHFRTIWVDKADHLMVINQLKLPHVFEILALPTFDSVCDAIRNMVVRGAGLIGATAGYGMWLAGMRAPRISLDSFDDHMKIQAIRLRSTRPTASNLGWAVDRQLRAASMGRTIDEKIDILRAEAHAIADEDCNFCYRIGQHGLRLITDLYQRNGNKQINILTHCNAGWLAFVDHGSALSPIYAAHNAGLPIHIWVDETRPRNQGASLTAWELASHGVPHSLISDNAGGHLMQHGMVDMVITGADRVTRNGDVANKIGTYLKALAAKDNQVPFYVALPSSTFDFSLMNGVVEIPIEERSGEEVRMVEGKLSNGTIGAVQICPDNTPARNWGFDVTPARLITALLSERGLCAASETGIIGLYPEGCA